MVLNSFTYMLIGGVPLIVYLGIVTLSLLLITAYLGWRRIYFKWHKRFAIITVVWALVHGGLGLLAYL